MEFVKLHLGLVLVIVGVTGEGIEIIWKLVARKRSQKADLILDTTGFFFWVVLVVGLALEIPDAARTDKEAATANKLANEANERAAITESNNLILRSNVIALEAKLQKAKERTITQKQFDNFIKFLARFPKTPVKVFVGMEDRETDDFARNVRNILDAAGYGTGKPMDVISVGPISRFQPIDSQVRECEVKIVFFGDTTKENPLPDLPGIKFRYEQQLLVPVFEQNDVRAAPAIIQEAFINIGMCAPWAGNTSFLAPGEWGIFIPQKF